jgi:acetyl esterase/lipase
MKRVTLPTMVLSSSLALLPAPASAAPPSLPWPDAAPAPAALDGEFASAVMPPVVVTLPGMERVGLKRNLVYTGIEDPNLRMDVYTPPDARAGERRPAVLFLHGGTDSRSQPKDWGIYQSWGRLAAASGLVGVTFTQRLGFPRTQLNEGAADVVSAIAYLRAHAAELGVDADRLCLAAYSGGGPLLAPYLSGAGPEIRCLVGYYPILDVRQNPYHLAAETAATREAFSPIVRVGGGGHRPPLLLLRAGADAIPGLLATLDGFVAAALAADYPLTLVNLPGAPHGFDNKAPEPRAVEAVLTTLAFLKHHLERPAAAE